MPIVPEVWRLQVYHYNEPDVTGPEHYKMYKHILRELKERVNLKIRKWFCL